MDDFSKVKHAVDLIYRKVRTEEIQFHAAIYDIVHAINMVPKEESLLLLIECKDQGNARSIVITLEQLQEYFIPVN